MRLQGTSTKTVIERLTQGELQLLLVAARTASTQDRLTDIDVRDAEIET